MTVFLYIILFLLILSVFQSYVFYPWTLRSRSRGLELDVPAITAPPMVSILIAAHNEDSVLAAKIDSILASDYPAELISILIGDDVSTDSTWDIIAQYHAQHPHIIGFRAEHRHGKPRLINRLADMAIETHGDDQIFILTDANVNLEPMLISELVRHNTMEGVGLVGANTKFSLLSEDTGIAATEQTYNERELDIKYAEGILWGTMMGPFGACFSMRADLWRPVPDDFIVDDFWSCMSVLQQGAKAILARPALAYEQMVSDASVEYRRKVRMATGNLQNLFYFKYLLFSPLPGLSYAYWSHKVLRWMTPISLLLSYIIIWVLFWRGEELKPLLIVSHVVLLLCLIDPWLERLGLRTGFLRSLRHFLMMNIAMLEGYWNYFIGRRSSIWKPTARS